MKQEIHIVPFEKKWAVKTEKTKKPNSTHKTKMNAIKAGTKLAKNKKTELVIHKRDGTFENKNSHGNDPFPPRDKKP